MASSNGYSAWRIPWTEEPGELQSMGSQRVGQDWVTNTFNGYYGGSTPTGLLNNCPMSLILSQDPLPCRIRWRSDSLQEGAVRPRVVLGNLGLFRLAEPQNWGRNSSGPTEEKHYWRATWDVSQGKRKDFLPIKVKIKHWIWRQM